MAAIKTAEMERDAWLQERSKGIGGSDVATVLGLNPYKTPLSLWEEKTGKTKGLSLIHISEPTRQRHTSRMPSSA